MEQDQTEAGGGQGGQQSKGQRVYARVAKSWEEAVKNQLRGENAQKQQGQPAEAEGLEDASGKQADDEQKCGATKEQHCRMRQPSAADQT